MRVLFNTLPKESLSKLGKVTGLSAREYIAYFYHSIDLHSMTKYLDLSFSRFQAYQHHVDELSHRYSLVHDININFSTFYSGFLGSLIESVIGSPPKFMEVADGAIAFMFNIRK